MNNILTSYFNIHNSNDGKYINIELDGKKKKCKTLNEVAEIAYSKSQEIFVDVKYANSDSKSAIDKLRTEQSYDLKQAFCAQFVNELSDYIHAKKELRDNYIQNTLPSAFNAKFIAASFKPAGYVNEIDEKFISNIVYSEEQDALYYVNNGAYKMLGTIAEIVNKDSKAIYLLTSCINNELSIKFNVEYFDFWSYLYQQIDKATDAFFEAKVLFETLAQRNEKINPDQTLTCVPWSEKVSMYYFSDKKTGLLCSDWYDRLHSYFIKSIFTYLIPASGVNNDLYNVYYETLNDESGTFKRYAIKPTHGAKCTFETYISKLFSERYAIQTMLKKININPHIISDDSTPAEFQYDPTWLDRLTDQAEIGDAKVLNAFLSPYSKEEKLIIMAWAYTVFHPSLNDNIHFLFMTGGQTFKTNYYAAMIVKILQLAYKSNRNLTHYLERDMWITDSFLRESSTTGISNAALVHSDECTDKCLDQFKAMSGGTSDGINYQKRMMRETPISMKIFCKWLFTTNKFFAIQDDSGAFDRRLVIIKRMDVNNLAKPYAGAIYDKMKFKEIKVFYELAKWSYNEILKTATDLQDYRNKQEVLRRNLNEAYQEEEKLQAYSVLFERIFKSAIGTNSSDGSIRVKGTLSTPIIEEVSKEYNLNINGFRNWIKHSISTIKENKYTTMHFSDGRASGWVLYPLKQAIQEKLLADCDEVEDNDTFSSKIADENENVIPSNLKSYISRPITASIIFDSEEDV